MTATQARSVFSSAIVSLAMAAAPGHTANTSPPAQQVAHPIEILASQPLLDRSVTVQKVTTANCELFFELAELLPDKNNRRTGLIGSITRIDDTWQAGRAGPATATGSFTVTAKNLTLTGATLKGSFVARHKSDPTQTFECDLDGQITPINPSSRPADDAPSVTGMRFWTIQPKTREPLWLLQGTYKARHGDQTIQGALGGSFMIPIRPNLWSTGTSDIDGLKLAFNMGAKRVTWNHARLSQTKFNEPRDWSKHSGLQIKIATDQPRADVSVSVWVSESDGSWYYVKSAVPLVDASNEAVILFEDFDEAEWVAPGSHIDEDYTLDLSSVAGIAIGVVNPLGVGNVAFTVKEINLVQCRTEPLPPVNLRVTGKTLAVNSHDLVPAGIFGGYAPDLPADVRPGCQRYLGAGTSPRLPQKGEKFVIDCFSDRYQPATLLVSPHWREQLAAYGKAYGENSKTNSHQAHWEFWNEPYLNWAERSRINLNSKFYRTDLATENGPVQVAYTNGPVIPHFKWVKDPQNGSLKVIDETAFSYWSSAGNGWIYDQMLGVVGPAIKQANPDVQILIGWGFRWNEDHWAAWDLIYKPSIDRNIDWIDGVGEHHYQGDTTAMNGSYEVLSAYAVTRHKKWLYAYNTETGDLIDAPARGIVDTPEKAKLATVYRRAVYNLRDCIFSVYQSPDKYRARTVIHNDANGKTAGDKPHSWTHVAYGMMSNLRGRLIQTESTDDFVWVVASVDGTDPHAMPPAGTPPTLVVMAFNDHRHDRDIALNIQAPDGVRFTKGVIEEFAVDKSIWAISRVKRYIKTSGKTAHFNLRLPARTAWKISFPLKGRLAANPQVQRRQFFSPDILQHVNRSHSLNTTVQIDPASLKTAQRAWARLVVEDVAPGEAVMEVAGAQHALPKAYTADNINRILMIPLPVAALKESTPIQFRVADGNHDGYRVAMTSIMLEQ
jgi:hypothetical protein